MNVPSTVSAESDAAGIAGGTLRCGDRKSFRGQARPPCLSPADVRKIYTVGKAQTDQTDRSDQSDEMEELMT